MTGQLYSQIGIRWTFRVYGISSIVLLILYALMNILVFKEFGCPQGISVEENEVELKIGGTVKMIYIN